jgi:hypothetical protein
MSNEIPVKEKETLVEKKMRELEEKRGLPSGDGLSVTGAYRERFRKDGTLGKWRGKRGREDGKGTLSSPVGKDDYEQLKTENRKEMAGLRSASDYPERRTTDMTLEGVKPGDKDQGKVPVDMTDEEANKAASSEAGLSGGLHSDQALTGAIASVVGERTNQVPDAGPSVSGPDDRLEGQYDVKDKISGKESHTKIKGVFLETRIGGHRDDEILSNLWGKRGLSLRYIRNEAGKDEGDDWLLFVGKKKGDDEVSRYMVPAKVLLKMGRVGGSYAHTFSERYGIGRPSANKGEEFVKRMESVTVDGRGLGAEKVEVLELTQEAIMSIDAYKQYREQVSDERRLKDSIRGKDKSGKRRRGFEIGSDETKYFGEDGENMAKFFEVWKDENVGDKDLKGRVFKNKKGDLMFSLQGGEKKALVKVSSLEIIAAEYDEKYGWGNWTKGFLDELSVDGVARKGVKVEIDGSVNRRRKGKSSEGVKESQRTKDEGGYVMNMREIPKGDRGKVDGLKKVRSILEMDGGKPSFEVQKTRDGRVLVQVSKGSRKQVVNGVDLLNTLGQVTKMDKGANRHWGLGDKLSVDLSSSPEDWERFLGNL